MYSSLINFASDLTIPDTSGVFVKICGITHVEDAAHALSCGADALGFVAYQKSRRYIAPHIVQKIVAELHSEFSVARFVGVFVNEEPEVIIRYILAGVNIVQLHGEETQEAIASVVQRVNVMRGRGTPPPLTFWKAIRPRSISELERYTGYPADDFLIDSFVRGEYGGCGITGDWSMAKSAVRLLRKPVILAGGLNPGNVAEAIQFVRPFGVDVSSGVENDSGRKDHALVERFIAAARGSEAK